MSDKNAEIAELGARLAAVEALVQQTILRMASPADPAFGDIVDGTADQIVQSISGRMRQGPEVVAQVQRILGPVRKEAAASRARWKIQKAHRDIDD
jgi:hypothetical protein